MFNRNPLFATPLRYAVTVIGALAFNLAVWSGVHSQISNPGVQASGAITFGHCTSWGPGVGQIQDAGAACAGAVTPSALTQSNDTNVTLTLSGTPATALLQAVQLQMGWNGTLAVVRGGTGGGTASGTLLDNITGFVSTGLISRTGAGTYSFTTPAALTKTDDTNVTLTLGGTPASALLQAASITVGWNGTLAITRGGTGAGTQQGALNNIAPTPTRAGDIIYYNGTNWVALAGNNSGTLVLTENALGVPSWSAAGTGTVTSVTCSGGLTGGTFTTAGTCQIGTAGATLSAQPANPTGTASASLVHMGFGVTTCRVTPQFTKMSVEVDGMMSSTAATPTPQFSGRFGTGAGPANGAPATGTQFGAGTRSINPNGIGNLVYWRTAGVLTGLAPGVTIWIDGVFSSNSGTTNISVANCNAFDIAG